jgi:hypothetical protein
MPSKKDKGKGKSRADTPKPVVKDKEPVANPVNNASPLGELVSTQEKNGEERGSGSKGGVQILSDAPESDPLSVKQEVDGPPIAFHDYLKNLIISAKKSPSSDPSTWGKIKVFIYYKLGGKYISKYTDDTVVFIVGSKPWGKIKVFSYEWGGKYISKYTSDIEVFLDGNEYWGKIKASSYKWIGKYASKYTGDFVALIVGGGGTLWKLVDQKNAQSIPAYSTLLSDSGNFFAAGGELLKINDKQHKAKEKYTSYFTVYNEKIRNAQDKVTTEALIGFQGRSYYKKYLPDYRDGFRSEKIIKFTQMVIYGGMVIFQGICIRKMMDAAKKEDDVSDFSKMFLAMGVVSLFFKILNSFMNWSEYFSNKQSAAEKDMEAMGKALQLLDNLDANKGEIYKLVEPGSTQQVKIEAEVGRKIDRLNEKKKEILHGRMGEVEGNNELISDQGKIDIILENFLKRTVDKDKPLSDQEKVVVGKEFKKYVMQLWQEEPYVFQQVLREIGEGALGEIKTYVRFTEVKDYILEEIGSLTIERPDGNDLTLDNLFHEWAASVTEV